MDFHKISNDCLYTDVDDTRTNPTLKLVVIVTNYKNNIVLGQDINLLIIIYINNGCLIPLNDWDNSNYFITLFPTLSPFGTDGHLALNKRFKKIKVSLDIWRKWVLYHHPRRYNNYHILNVYQY